MDVVFQISAFLKHIICTTRYIEQIEAMPLCRFLVRMGATVLRMARSGLLVRTDQLQIVIVHPWTNEDRIASFPFRCGYATTLHKVQGATLPHVTLWLDLPNMPASAYVGLSRVEKDANWRFIGVVNRHHFTPARFD